MHSSDAAESIVRMSLNGLEVAARITGSGAKNIAALIYTILKDKQTTKGKTKLANMIKTGKELKVFTVDKTDLKKFTEEAKRYGILFCALTDRGNKSTDGVVDIMVKAEDASRINRIVKRFNFATVDTATIENVYNDKTKETPDKGIEVLSKEDRLVNDLLTKPISKEENEVSNPNLAKMEKSSLSEPSSEIKKGSKSKPSVREEIKSIKMEQKKELDLVKETKEDKKDIPKTNLHIQPKKKKSKERS